MANESPRPTRSRGIFLPDSMVTPQEPKPEVVRKPRGRTTILVSGVLLGIIAAAIGIAILGWMEFADPLLALFHVHSSASH